MLYIFNKFNWIYETFTLEIGLPSFHFQLVGSETSQIITIQIQKLKRSIENESWLFAVCVWQNNILTGFSSVILEAFKLIMMLCVNIQQHKSLSFYFRSHFPKYEKSFGFKIQMTFSSIKNNYVLHSIVIRSMNINIKNSIMTFYFFSFVGVFVYV